jgi:iduronate 2-sulfatase
MKKALAILVPALFACNGVATMTTARAAPANVLFIAVDDLRPELGAYGSRHMHTPNIDRLAARGLLFNRAYCQYSSCNPSRSSLITGLRPDSTGVPAGKQHFRQHVPDVVTLPQLFKQHGYETRAFGKLLHSVFDTAFVGRDFDDPPSWSKPNWYGTPQYYFTPKGMTAARKVFESGRGYPGFPEPGSAAAAAQAARRSRSGPPGNDWTKAFVQALPTEVVEVADAVPYDGQVNERAIEALREMKDRPFFLAVGYLRPHLPFVAPRKYWDLYDRSRIQLPNPVNVPRHSPEAVIPSWAEMRGPPTGELRRQYSGIPKSGVLPEDLTRELIHGYYACVSYVDALIGRLVGEVDRLGLRENTIIVLWSDHGWHLGEQLHWGKHANFELANRVPLIVSAPKQRTAGAKTNALVELVDIYPSLCDLAGLPLPGHLEGTSFAPLLDQPDRTWKPAAFSQVLYGKVEGRTIRTERYRYVRWHDRSDPKKALAVELYDLLEKPVEFENIANRPENAALVRDLEAKLQAGWKGARL